MIAKREIFTFIYFLLITGALTFLAVNGLLFSNLYLLILCSILLTSFIWTVLTHYKIGRLSWSETKQIHFTSGIMAVIVGSLLLVLTQWGKSGVIILLPTHTYFLFYACRLVIDSLRDDKSFDKWSMIWSSLFLFAPFGLYFASLYSITENSLKNVQSNFDYICFSFATLLTAGCRDIQPNSNIGSALYLINMFIGIIIVAVFVAGCFNLPDKVQKREQSEAEPSLPRIANHHPAPKKLTNNRPGHIQPQKSKGKRKSRR